MKFTLKLFWGSHLFMLFLLILWFSPLTQPFCQLIDNNIFFVLNGSLRNHPFLEYFWGMLNHRREVLLNLLAAAGISFWAIMATKDPILRKEQIKQVLYFWVCFEIGFQLQDVIFNRFLEIQRLSPSLVLQPVVKLSSLLENSNIKDFSRNSFPSGHAFAMIYWGSFTFISAPKHIARLGLLFAIFFCLPRLYSGAHWFSDEVFSGVLALVWLSWTINIPLYRKIIGVKF